MCNWKIRFVLPLLFVISAVLLAPAASSAQAPITLDDLLGVWRWERSSGGFVGEIILPTTDQWMQLEFEPEGQLRASLSGVLAEGTYSVISDPGNTQIIQLEIVGIPPAWPLPFLSQTFFVSSPAPGMLILDEGCCDRYMHEFASELGDVVPIEQPSVSDCKGRWTKDSN
jgi:hypothetical protein